ncbi:uncharacterized protein G6M90_00g067570 [Metarhizium brunneum]|uniref:Uncharacterized protein n=1 Tax=Metarhizium brunneum TaxID=500148 RepID=A0A7D5Z8V1_9HYPO|nr:hypothetical protein G6M90_00g067570 [Metarhizium brunneum]
MALSAIATILPAGCTTSSSLQNVYLLSLSYIPNATINSSSSYDSQLNPGIGSAVVNLSSIRNPSLIVRVGYLGICISYIDD